MSQSLSSLTSNTTTLGVLLDGGAKRLTGAEFRKELVGPQVSGASAMGHRLDVIYLDSGAIRGSGSANIMGVGGGGITYEIEGTWSIDDLDRVCVTMRLGAAAILPVRCQFWFQYQEGYYLSDSDTDRSIKVLRRTVAR